MAETNFDLVITDDDRAAARAALVDGWHNCKYTNYIGQHGKPCDCDHGAIDGCKAKLEGVAKAIAFARRL